MKKKQIISLTLVAVLTYMSMGFACSKASTLSWAKESVLYLQEAEPLLVELGLPADKIELAISYDNKLISALEDPNSGNGDPKQLAESLITAVEAVVQQTNVITNQHKKVVILAILGLVNIALHHIADNVTSTPTGAFAAGPAVLKFKARPVWKCRSAQTGHYEKMEFCKAHPDVSVVEMY